MEVESAVNTEGRRLALGAAAVGDAEGEEQPLPLRYAIRVLLACAWCTIILIIRRRIHQPNGNLGRRIPFANGTTAEVYRETVIDRPPPKRPAVLVVCFRLRGVPKAWGHALFRLESELNTVLFAGFRGLVSKLWLRHDQEGAYRGLYQWDDPDQAVAYVQALWWPLSLVSEPGSVHYAVLPGLDRDQVIANPALIDTLVAAPRGWWRPSAESGGTAQGFPPLPPTEGLWRMSSGPDPNPPGAPDTREGVHRL
jgi:hypothetical protein